MAFRKATKQQSRLRMALTGVSGSGKTFTSLRFAFSLTRGGSNPPKVAVIQAESGTIEKYLGMAPDGVPFDFDVNQLEDFSPEGYIAAILEGGQLGYDVLIIDSLSHEWNGSGGALELVDKNSRKYSGNKFAAWGDVTPSHNRMIEAIVRSPCHVIATMRSKMDYALEDRGGKKVPVRLGLGPVQREGMEYEFDILADLDRDHCLIVQKTRFPMIDGEILSKPGAEFMAPVWQWLYDGVEIPADHFARTDSDLKIEAAKRESSMSDDEREARRLAQIEEMNRQIQQQTAGSVPSSTDPPANGTPTVRPIQPAQQAEIKSLGMKLFGFIDEEGVLVADFGLMKESIQQIAGCSPGQLNESTAADVLIVWNRQLSEKVGADAAAKLQSSPGGMSTSPGSMTPEQKQRINELHQRTQWPREDAAAWFEKHGVAKASDLSQAQAAELIGYLCEVEDELRAAGK